MKLAITPVTGGIAGAIVLGLISWLISADLTFVGVVLGAGAGVLAAKHYNKPARTKKIHRAVHR